jgi:hypothetical protein
MKGGRGGVFWRDGKILSTSLYRGTKPRYSLRDDDGLSITLSPQSITYKTFVGTIPDGYYVQLKDNDKPASVDNLELRWQGIRPAVEKKQRPKTKKSAMEGYCSLIGDFLRMRYT